MTEKPVWVPGPSGERNPRSEFSEPLVYRSVLPVAELRSAISKSPLKRYVSLELPPVLESTALRRRLDRELATGWQVGRRTILNYTFPLKWEGHPRYIAFWLNAWKPFARFLQGYDLLGHRPYFDLAYRAALEWLKKYQEPALQIRTIAELDQQLAREEDFVWYDIGVAVRLASIAFIFDVIARDRQYPDEAVELFADALYFHQEALAREAFYQSHNNHGIYQALGQLAGSKRFPFLPNMDRYAASGSARIEELVNGHFFPSGVHKEHSPGYHRLLVRTLLNAQHCGLLTSPKLLAMIGRMERALCWMTMPNRVLAAFGDTDASSSRRPPDASSPYNDPELNFLLSDGLAGTPPALGVQTYADAGYIFARVSPARGSVMKHPAYLAQIAGFHSRTHKHADHLSFIWYDRMRPILVDSGFYPYSGRTAPDSNLSNDGFWYSDPKRIYVESTRAHNTVEVDGRSHPRAGVAPFGSAIIFAGEENGLVVTHCAVTLFDTVHHRRILIMSPGEYLLVLDMLKDHNMTVRRYVQRFHFAPQWSLRRNGRKLEATVTKPPEIIQAVNLVQSAEMLPAVRGQVDPDFLGWCAGGGDLVPTSTFGYARDDSGSAHFAALFAFARSADAEPDGQHLDDRNGQLSWRMDGRLVSVSFGVSESGRVAVDQVIEGSPSGR